MSSFSKIKTFSGKLTYASSRASAVTDVTKWWSRIKTSATIWCVGNCKSYGSHSMVWFGFNLSWQETTTLKQIQSQHYFAIKISIFPNPSARAFRSTGLCKLHGSTSIYRKRYECMYNSNACNVNFDQLLHAGVGHRASSVNVAIDGQRWEKYLRN